MKKNAALWVVAFLSVGLCRTLFAELSSTNPNSANNTPLIAKGAVWKYWPQTHPPPAGWQEAALDDAEWASGRAQLGYGDGDEATVLYDKVAAAQRPVTAYLRKAFQVSNIAAVQTLGLKLLRDDGAVLYLNGVELYRNNMPAGPVESQTLALTSINHDAEKTYISAILPAHLLVQGVNVLAVEIHQVVAGSADMSFDLELTPNVSNAEPGALTLIARGAEWKYLDDGSDQGTAWIQAAFDDSAWKAGLGPLGYANGNEATVVSYGPDPSHKYITTYFRKKFHVADPAAISNLVVRVMRDDGAATYLNGIQITRGNLAANATYLTPARSNYGPPKETNYYSANVNPALLVAGENILAAEVHQYSGASADLSFDLELTGRAGAPNLPPVVTLTSPTGEESFTAPADVALAATVKTGSSEVLWVEFFANGQLIGRDTNSPYGLVWSQAPAGNYTLVATATDARRNQASSKPVAITVAAPANQPPTVSITKPQSGAGFVAPADIELLAVAADADGAVASVEFFANGVSLGQAQAAQNPGQPPAWQLLWTAVPPGQYQVTARATDDQGAPTTSATVLISVGTAAAKPVVTVSATNRVAVEGAADVAEFLIQRAGGNSTAPLTVYYSLSGTAENGVDYAALPDHVTIPAGAVSAPVIVRALADFANEFVETVVLTIVSDTEGTYQIGEPNTYTNMIVEAPPMPGLAPAGDEPLLQSLAGAAVAPGFPTLLYGFQRLPDGQCQMTIISEPGKAVIIEASEDLDNWTPLATLPNPAGVLEFTDPSAANFKQTFYRLVVE